MAVILDGEAAVRGCYVDGCGSTPLRILEQFCERLIDAVTKHPFNAGTNAIVINEDAEGGSALGQGRKLGIVCHSVNVEAEG